MKEGGAVRKHWLKRRSRLSREQSWVIGEGEDVDKKVVSLLWDMNMLTTLISL